MPGYIGIIQTNIGKPRNYGRVRQLPPFLPLQESNKQIRHLISSSGTISVFMRIITYKAFML